MPNTHTHDAWIIGTHQFPDSSVARRLAQTQHRGGANLTGQMIVHNLSTDQWSILEAEDFDRLYVWI